MPRPFPARGSLETMGSRRGASNTTQGSGGPHTRQRQRPCKFYNTHQGCRHGSSCTFAHIEPGAAGEEPLPGGRRAKQKPGGHRTLQHPGKSPAGDELVSSLEGMSLTPKQLLIMDVNGLLLYRVNKRQEPDPRIMRPPDTVIKNFKVWIRPGAHEFVDFCCRHFVIAVWSSARLQNFKPLLPPIFGDNWEDSVAVVWGQDRCSDLSKLARPVMHPQNRHKPIFLKETSKLWKHFGRSRFGPHNTLLVDDSVYKTALNPEYTALHPAEWVPWQEHDEGLHELTRLLKSVTEAQDVRECLRGNEAEWGHPVVCGGERRQAEFRAIPGLIEYQRSVLGTLEADESGPRGTANETAAPGRPIDVRNTQGLDVTTSPSPSMSQPVTEAELVHYKEVMHMLKSRWSGITAEAKVKMTTLNEDSVQYKESMNEFKTAWASADVNSNGTLTREEFCVFNHKHLSNIKARLGWAPDLTKGDSEHIWEAIHALNPDVSGISVADYGRYHAVMKEYIN